jgi:hypothetical protein
MCASNYLLDFFRKWIEPNGAEQLPKKIHGHQTVTVVIENVECMLKVVAIRPFGRFGVAPGG